MNTQFSRSVSVALIARLLTLLVLSIALTACASGPRLVQHSFSFNGRLDKWTSIVEILEFQYGDEYQMVHRKAENDGQSRVANNFHVAAPMPVGDFLFVKWRIKGTGEVIEDRVDLRRRLPKDISDHEITFVIEDRLLYVYLITPTKIRLNLVERPQRNFASLYRVTYQIYPTNELTK